MEWYIVLLPFVFFFYFLMAQQAKQANGQPERLKTGTTAWLWVLIGGSVGVALMGLLFMKSSARPAVGGFARTPEIGKFEGPPRQILSGPVARAEMPAQPAPMAINTAPTNAIAVNTNAPILAIAFALPILAGFLGWMIHRSRNRKSVPFQPINWPEKPSVKFFEGMPFWKAAAMSAAWFVLFCIIPAFIWMTLHDTTPPQERVEWMNRNRIFVFPWIFLSWTAGIPIVLWTIANIPGIRRAFTPQTEEDKKRLPPDDVMGDDGWMPSQKKRIANWLPPLGLLGFLGMYLLIYKGARKTPLTSEWLLVGICVFGVYCIATYLLHRWAYPERYTTNDSRAMAEKEQVRGFGLGDRVTGKLWLTGSFLIALMFLIFVVSNPDSDWNRRPDQRIPMALLALLVTVSAPAIPITLLNFWVHNKRMIASRREDPFLQSPAHEKPQPNLAVQPTFTTNHGSLLAGLLAALHRRWLLASVLGSIAGGMAFMGMQSPFSNDKHEVIALIEINTDKMSDAESRQVGRELLGQKILLRNHSFLSRVAQAKARNGVILSNLSMLATSDDPAKMIDDMIRIRWVAPDLLSIRLCGDEPDQLKLILDELIDEFVLEANKQLLTYSKGRFSIREYGQIGLTPNWHGLKLPLGALAGILAFASVVFLVAFLEWRHNQKQRRTGDLESNTERGIGYRIIVGLWIVVPSLFVSLFLFFVVSDPGSEFNRDHQSRIPLVLLLAFWSLVIPGTPTLIRYVWLNRRWLPSRIKEYLLYAHGDEVKDARPFLPRIEEDKKRVPPDQVVDDGQGSQTQQDATPGYWVIVGLWIVAAMIATIFFFSHALTQPEEMQHSPQDWVLIPLLLFWYVCLIAGIPTLVRLWWINRERITRKLSALAALEPPDSPIRQTAAPVPQAATEPPPLPSRSCPKCSAPIATDAPQGMCPKCLMAGAFRSILDSNRTSAYKGTDIPPSPEEVQEFFPNLEILGLIGHGGMGAVYQARQPNLDRIVALKLIRPREDNPMFAERFVREARAMAKLNHANIVTIYESGEAGGSLYLIMEFIDGITLREAIRAKAIPPSEAMKIVGQLCEALEYAHSQGVVHRDIKPENILLDRMGKVRVVDFGLAKLSDDNGMSLTHTRQAMGTPHYMAPEQWEKPTEVDHRADIYALGVVIYELLTGELPLGRFDPPSVKSRLDARIDEIVLRLLAKEPDKRYQHASDVRTALFNYGQHSPMPSGTFYEYKSETTVMGWPLVHIVRGVDPRTGKRACAKGVVAIGRKAVGVVAIGQFAAGLIAIGQFAVGLFALGQFVVGPLFAIGQLALSLLFSIGMLSTGFFTIGLLSFGYFVISTAGWGWKRISTERSDPDFGEHFRELCLDWWQ